MTIDEERQQAIDAANEENKLLRAGVCPRCNRPISSKPDRRQGGASSVIGMWHKYKCEHCGYFCDLLHPDNN